MGKPKERAVKRTGAKQPTTRSQAKTPRTRSANNAAPLSQTVQENSAALQSLMTLPEVVTKQGEMLENIMAFLQPSDPEDESVDVNPEGLDESDQVLEVGDFISGVLDEANADKGKAVDHDMTAPGTAVESIIDEVLKSNETAEEYGSNLPESVAGAFRRAITQQSNKEVLDKLRPMHKPPGNLKEIGVPKVNSEIWNAIPRRAQTTDATQQYLQQYLSRGLVAQARLAECITKNANGLNPEVVKELLTLTMDSVNQLGFAFREISLRRRQQIKPFLNNESATLCSSAVPITELLFGSNLDKDISTAKASAKIMKPSFRGQGHRGFPNRRPFATPARNLNFRRPFNRGGHRQPFASRGAKFTATRPYSQQFQ